MKKLIISLFIFSSIISRGQTTVYLEASGTHYGANGTFSNWTNTGNSISVPTYAAGFKQSTTIASTTIAVNNSSSTASTCFAQFISPVLVPQTISGTVTGYARMSLSSASGCTAQSRVKITVINQTGAVVATLLSMTSGASNLTTTLTSYQILNAASLTSYTCTYGDRICIEVGIGRSAGTTARNGTISFGSSSATNITSAGSTTANNPVITFSNTLQFYQGSAIAVTSTLGTGLVSYWNFEESSGNALDIIGGANGTVTGGTMTRQVTGKNNFGYEFSTSSAFAGIDCGATNLIGTSSWTYAIWVKYVTPHRAYFFSNGATGGNNGIRIESNSDYLGSAIFGGASNFGEHASGLSIDLSDGSWHQIVCVFDRSGNKTMWIDGNKGTPHSITSYSGENITPSDNFDMIVNVGSGAIDLIFDEAMVWNRALTDSEVVELNNSGNGKFYPFN